MVTARTNACSKPRPASTLMTRRSRTSGNFLRMASCRASMARLSQASGPMTPAKAIRKKMATRSIPRTDVYAHATYQTMGVATTDRTWKTRNLSASSGLAPTGDDQLLLHFLDVLVGKSRPGHRRR